MRLIIIIKLIANWWAWELVPSELGGGPAEIPDTAGRFHGNPVSGNQPCKRPPISTVTLMELQWRNLPYPLPTMNHFLPGKDWALNWQNRPPKEWPRKLNWASKLQMWWSKQWSVQGSDPQRKAEQTTAIMATIAHMQAHGKASPWGHPTDHRDRWTHWPEVNGSPSDI